MSLSLHQSAKQLQDLSYEVCLPWFHWIEHVQERQPASDMHLQFTATSKIRQLRIETGGCDGEYLLRVLRPSLTSTRIGPRPKNYGVLHAQRCAEMSKELVSVRRIYRER